MAVDARRSVVRDPAVRSVEHLRRHARLVAAALRRGLGLARRGGCPAVRRPWAWRATVRPTFDVFETLLTTRVVPSNAVWSQVGREAEVAGLLRDGAAAFVRNRRAASKYFRDAGVEPSFEALVAETVRDLGLGDDQLAQLMEIELAVTAACLYPIPQGRERLIAARNRSADGRVVFISDIYLPSSFLRRCLLEHGCWRAGDGIWASSEAGRRKVDTGLFRLVSAHEGAGSLRFRHTGDRELEDGTAARWAGFLPEVVTDAVPTPREHLLARSGDAHLWALLAGAARQTRLTSPRSDDPVDTTIRDLGTEIAGPVLAGFALWVLHQAATRGWSQVQLGGDAQVARSMMERFTRATGSDLEVLEYSVAGEVTSASGGHGVSGSPACGYVALRRRPVGAVASRAHPPSSGSRDELYLFDDTITSADERSEAFLPRNGPAEGARDLGVLIETLSQDGDHVEGGLGVMLRRVVSDYATHLAASLRPEHLAQVRPNDFAAYLGRAALRTNRSEDRLFARLAALRPAADGARVGSRAAGS